MALWKLSPYRLTTALESFEGITAYCPECGYTIDTHEGDVLPDHCPECGVAIDGIRPWDFWSGVTE